MKTAIKEVKGVAQIDDLKTRLFGSRVYVDVEISADETLSFLEAHRIAENTQNAIESIFPDVKRCMVHVNPVLVLDTKAKEVSPSKSLNTKFYRNLCKETD